MFIVFDNIEKVFDNIEKLTWRSNEGHFKERLQGEIEER